MKQVKLAFLHGLEGSPNGFKARRIKQYDPMCWCPKLTTDVRERIQFLIRETPGPMLLIGSSLGGLTAIAYAMKSPENVLGMVLLAPAVGVFRSSGITGAEQSFLKTTFIPESIPTVIIAANQDQVIPMDAIDNLFDRSQPHSNLKYLKVDSDHTLNDQHDLMIESIEWVKKQLQPENHAYR